MKRALVSVSDKTGLIEFLNPLIAKGLKIVSTGGTLQFLKDNKISAMDISEVTDFPEVLDGRVKTLHPMVHMGLLADLAKPSHVEQLKQHKVESFDLVVGNLYPFEQTALSPESSEEMLIEKIDIGGPSFLRSAAKNFKCVTVVCDPKDYVWVQSKILDNKLEIADRQVLAMKVFSLTSYYDALIVQKLAKDIESFDYLNLPLRKKSQLRYGENSQQKASWFENPLQKVNLASAEFHQGKELSYNNILDLDASVGLVICFTEPACVAVKHNNPCAAAIGKNSSEAAAKVIESDPKSIFGGILAFNKVVDLETCKLLQPLFLECVIAPSFSPEALEALKIKKNLRVLSWPSMRDSTTAMTYKSVLGGVLQQSADFFSDDSWKTHGAIIPADIKKSMLFGEKICAFLKSNAIALVYRNQTVGLGMGQVNRVDAVQQAFLRLKEYQSRNSINLDEVVLISDAFFPFPDSIDLIAEHNIKWILQPGGSVKDLEVINTAMTKNISMTLTSQRHFRH